MTTPSPETTYVAPPVVTCNRCGEQVPAGAYCGACGSHEPAATTIARPRSHAFAAAPGEHLLHPSFVTTLFPQLPHRARAPFRMGFMLLVVTVVALGLLRLQAPLVAVCALGVPLLFLIYLYEVDVYEDYHWVEVLAVLAVAAGAGVLWAEFTGPVVTHAATRTAASGLSTHDLLVSGILIPAAAQLIMLVPAAVIWMRRLHRNEAMDGFVVGAAGALGFVLTDTLTRLWPQLSDGVVADTRGAGTVLAEGVLQGLTVPVVAACASALVASTVWVRRRDAVHPGRWTTSPLLALVFALAVQAGLGVTDLSRLSLTALVAVHVAAAVLLLLALRVALHFVLLHEAREVTIGPPHVCPHCRHVVPSMPFCAHCGFAIAAVTRAHRRLVRLDTSVPGETP